MTLGMRGKFFIVSAALILAAMITGGLVLNAELRGWYETHTESDLEHLADTARILFENVPQVRTLEEIDAIADRLGDAAAARITILDPDGRVLGDSTLTPGQVRALESHADRTEVVDALRKGKGLSIRYSTTLHTNMMYLAESLTKDGKPWVVRVARSLKDIDAVLLRFHVLLVIAGLVALGAALLLGALSAQTVSKKFRDLVNKARLLAEKQGRPHLDVRAQDEIGALSGSMNRMAEELEQVVEDLTHERDRFAAVLEGMQEGVLALDENQRITLANSAAANVLGFARSPEGLILLEAVRIPALWDLAGKAQAGQAVSGEFALLGERPLQILARAHPLRAGRGVVVVMHDVTELRRLESIRRDFVANASHELRTPVSIIKANAETLLGGAQDDRDHAPQFLEAILRNADRITRLIADLLDLSRIESGRHVLELADVPLEASIRKVVEALANPTQRRRQKVDVEIPSGLCVRAEVKALEQVIQNLIDNAIKYGDEGGRIKIQARAEGDRVAVEVCDDGPGIAPIHRGRIFERFYRIDPGRSREMGGTGLGLAIVKHLVEAMNGSIAHEPGSPRGSIFRIMLARGQSGREEASDE